MGRSLLQNKSCDREIAPTVGGGGFYQIRGRDREIAPTVGGRGRDGEVAIIGGEGKLCIKTEDIANYVKADGQHRVHIILLRLLRLKGNRS